MQKMLKRNLISSSVFATMISVVLIMGGIVTDNIMLAITGLLVGILSLGLWKLMFIKNVIPVIITSLEILLSIILIWLSVLEINDSLGWNTLMI